MCIVKNLIAIVCSGMLLTACSADTSNFISDEDATRGDQSNTPVVVTLDKVDIDVAAKTATAYGCVESEGTSAIVKRGFLLSSTDNDPRMGGKGVRAIAAGKGLGEYSKTISAVVAGKTYYLRAYAINATDTAYANVITFEQRAPKPALETYPVDIRVHRAAVVYGRFTKPSPEVTAFGCCLSTQPNPGLNDIVVTASDTCKTRGYQGEFGTYFDKLEADRLYHVRTFAITPTDTVFGGERIFKCARKGNLTWGFWYGEEEEARKAGAADRIRIALDSACYYYSNYSLLSKHMNVNYEPGVQTADCNIEGWLRFGPSSSYQWVGTTEHEIAHALGIGTASNWDSMFDASGIWKGKNANRILRAMLDDQTYNVRKSGIHFYPGGINYSSEVTSGERNSHGTTFRNERMLQLNALVLQGMRMDGLTSY